MVVMVRGMITVLAMNMIVMLVLLLFLEKIRVNIELRVEVEAAQIKYLGQGNLTKMNCFLRRTRVHVFKAVHQRSDFFLRDQIRFTDEYLVGKTHLAARLLARYS